jgi:hypothetical protein
MKEYKFKKLVAIVPEELFLRLLKNKVFSNDFDSLICTLLDEYVTKLEAEDNEY